MEELILRLINSIFKTGQIPDVLKAGLLTPIFKNKGDKNNSANYRGITVMPVISKIMETILRERIAPNVIAAQNPAQRGFTKNTSPMNASLLVEEMYRDVLNTRQSSELVLLDAKAAFDVVVHTHMMRRLFQAGLDDKHWAIIQSMHEGAASAIKWNCQISDQFEVLQGVQQGGILSTDLYKLYVNPLLDKLTSSNIGLKIGNIVCNTSAYADDIALMSRNEVDMQIQINMSTDFAGMDGYRLQPQKSVSIQIKPKSAKMVSAPVEYTLALGRDQMPNVERVVNLGIIRTTSAVDNIRENVDENMKKARRKAYALFGCGFHGENGLDPETMIHLFKTYVSPVLLYGMEVSIPKGKYLEQLEKFQKKMIKQLLSISSNTPDPAIYILTGLLPIEAQIHVKALTLFGNVCRQDETCI